MTEKRQKPSIPSREEADKVLDEILNQPWIGEMDRLRIGLLKDANYEYLSLRALVTLDPRQKTPAIAERLDALRKELQQGFADLGLTPAARRSLGLPPSSVGRKGDGDGLVAYRVPGNPQALIRHLVRTGAWGAVGAKVKAEIAAESDANDEGSGDAVPAQKATRTRAGHRNGNSQQTPKE